MREDVIVPGILDQLLLFLSALSLSRKITDKTKPKTAKVTAKINMTKGSVARE